MDKVERVGLVELHCTLLKRETLVVKTKNPTRMRVSLRAVVYPEDGWWLAHCLETDIVAEAKSPQLAVRELGDLCSLQVRVALEEGDLASAFRSAPAEVIKMFFLAREMPENPRQRGPIDRLEAREYVPS